MSSTEESDDHGYLPAIYDWPEGFGESSWWPIMLVIAATGMYVGAGAFLIGRGSGGIAMWIGAVVFVAALALFALVAFAWVYQAFVSHFGELSSHTGGRSLRFGMILFLATDVATFGAGFVYYFFLRLGGAWPQVHLPEGILSTILAVNTVALLASSFTFYWGERRLMRGDRRGFLVGVGVTTLLGVLFLCGQAFEYTHFIVNENFTIASGFFASAFFGLTGLHGMHVLLGVILLTSVLVRAYRGQYSLERHTSVTTVGWYWHFVDGVWLFLVAVIYVGSQIGVSLGL